MPIFKKILSLQKWRPFWIFEFFAKIAKHKNAYISKTLLDRAIRQNFWTAGYLCGVLFPIFKKFLSHQKWRPFWIFEILAKIAKHKNAYISKTVLDRAISTKFLTHRVSLQSSHATFQKKFLLPKMAAILNFRIFAQKLQNTKMLIFRKPCYIERFRRNFWSSGYLCRAAIPKSFHLVKFQTHS